MLSLKTCSKKRTMKKIENSYQLYEEMARLKVLISDQEKAIKEDVLEIKENLKPSNLLVNALSSITGFKVTNNEFLKDGLAYGLSILFQRFVLKTEKKLEHTVYEFIDTIIVKVKAFMEKFTSSDAKQSERFHDETDDHNNDKN